MAPSISSVPIPPAFVFFFFSESCKYLMVGTKDSYEKKKHCETLKCVQIMPYSNDEAKSMFSWKSLKYGRPFVSKLWHDIRAVFSHVYLQSFLPHDIRAFFCHVYLRSFLHCGYKRAYICAQKGPYICVTNKHVVYAVTESRRIESTELYRQPKTTSCTIQMKGNFGLTQSWLQWSRSFRARFCSYSLPSQ